VYVLRSTHEAKNAYIPYLPPPIPSLRLENFNHCNYQLLPAGYSMHSIAKKPVFDFLDNVSDIINKRSPTTWTPFFNLHCNRHERSEASKGRSSQISQSESGTKTGNSPQGVLTKIADEGQTARHATKT
jgi:hypothetical protein